MIINKFLTNVKIEHSTQKFTTLPIVSVIKYKLSVNKQERIIKNSLASLRQLC